MNRCAILLITAGLLGLSPAIFAETVYKCESVGGAVTFQQTACAGAANATAIELKSHRAPGQLEKPLPATPAEQHYYYLLRQYEDAQRALEAGGGNAQRGPSEEEKALEHLRNRRASQMGITRKELDRREGWKPRAR